MRDADFASFQGISVSAPSRRLVESLPFKVVLYALKSDNKNRRFAAVLSPLPDSNRGPPPYHGSSQATGGSRGQRIWLVFAASGADAFASGCHWLRPLGSIKAPYSLSMRMTADAPRAPESP